MVDLTKKPKENPPVFIDMGKIRGTKATPKSRADVIESLIKKSNP